MAVTYRYCAVDPATWVDNAAIEAVEESTIEYDLELATRGKMSLTSATDIGEQYIRCYMDDGGAEHCIGTFLAQTASAEHDGRIKRWKVDAYSPLLELKDDCPPLGYYAASGKDPVKEALSLANSHCRAPVNIAESGQSLTEDFPAKVEENWLDFLTSLLSKYNHRLMVAPNGCVYAAPIRQERAMRHVFEYNDGNASIIQADITDERDLYGIPNVVEVVAPNGMRSEARNENPDSMLSVQRRGRVIRLRETSPELPDGYTQDDVDGYAQRLMEAKSLVTHTVSFTHRYVRHVGVGDCVLLDFARAGIHAPAIIRAESADCTKDALVKTTATYTEVLS